MNIITLPIYSISKKSYDRKIEKNCKHTTSIMYVNCDGVETPVESKIYNVYQWKYNYVIGYIEVNLERGDIVFDTYFYKGKCFFNTNKKYPVSYYPINNTHFHIGCMNKEEIINNIKMHINIIKKILPRKNLYIDMCDMINVVKYLDIIELIKNVQ